MKKDFLPGDIIKYGDNTIGIIVEVLHDGYMTYYGEYIGISWWNAAYCKNLLTHDPFTRITPPRHHVLCNRESYVWNGPRAI